MSETHTTTWTNKTNSQLQSEIYPSTVMDGKAERKISKDMTLEKYYQLTNFYRALH